MPQLLATMSHGTFNYDDADVYITYHMCFITVDNNPSFKAVILFDTGSHGEVAAWIEEKASRRFMRKY
jgi:hypothetical protein